jgi:hypothetical protein
VAESFAETFDHLVQLCQTYLTDLVIWRRAKRAEYAVLELQGWYKIYLIQLREILRADGSRKYSYYVIHTDQIVAGFDNAADSDALRLKYGDQYTQRRLEEIPHFHTQNKQSVELTNEMTIDTFLDWLKQNL